MTNLFALSGRFQLDGALEELVAHHKYSFRIECQDSRLGIPDRLVVGRHDDETPRQVLLKTFCFLMFYRERLQFGGHLVNENIPFIPDLLQLDYDGRPNFWAECGPCDPGRLKKILAKAPDAEIWWVRESHVDDPDWQPVLKKGGIRPGRLRVLELPQALLDDLERLLLPRNEIYWMPADWEPPGLAFDFNSEWIESEFGVATY